MQARATAGKLQYSKFTAIGIFRCLEILNAAEPKALEALAEAAGVPIAKVRRPVVSMRHHSPEPSAWNPQQPTEGL